GNSKHVGDGAIGKWQGRYTREELETIEAIFNEFAISLYDFTLFPESLIDESILPKKGELSPEQIQKYQAYFYQQQATLAEIQIRFPSKIKNLDDVPTTLHAGIHKR